ncbi:metallopeptidase family protein [Tsukamurella sp. 8F]|uniref:metallopeptidase family protein n=1 Tax=unclassified Tsukamurella TaxID=2633480 RepID=UPI0023B88814|nr:MULTISPECIES: metallopeptidase family protein [unclassified Tsukamurella]MDF0530378.1 metallopeptidase family protein [Tsukamurella sp. 8J]MDF0587675.1 metallopeptidase family protein [Tsukamurella sp. 8F]
MSKRRAMDPGTRRRRAARDRRERGMRGPLVPRSVPAHRTRTQEFDEIVLDAYAEIDAMWHSRLSELDIAVDDVPGILPKDASVTTWPDEIVAEGPIPLARLIPAGIDRRGDHTRARLVLFRRPLLKRSKSDAELIELVLEILIHQIADYLGVTEDILTEGPDAL